MAQVFREIVKDRRAVRYDGRNTALPVPEQVRRQTCKAPWPRSSARCSAATAPPPRR